MILTGTYDRNKNIYVDYWEYDGEQIIYPINSEKGTAYVDLSSSNVNYNNCVLLTSSANYDITSLTIRVLDGFDIPIDEIVIDNYFIPAKGYIVLFPKYYQFLAFEKNAGKVNNYMTCSYNINFENFIVDLYD